MNERDRLVKIMEAEHMNAKLFSQEVGISAGTLSNILGGRNKPSLEVMQAILKRFRSISTQWLITGEGKMYEHTSDETMDVTEATNNDIKVEEDVVPFASKPTEQSQIDAASARYVRKILIFYSDGTFEER